MSEPPILRWTPADPLPIAPSKMPAATPENRAEHGALAGKIASIIAANPYLSRRRLRLENEGGKVTIHGTVGSYFQKQMAQEALRRIDGVERIENKLEVTWDLEA